MNRPPPGSQRIGIDNKQELKSNSKLHMHIQESPEQVLVTSIRRPIPETSAMQVPVEPYKRARGLHCVAG